MMKGITLCGECGHYDWEKRQCKRGTTKDMPPHGNFFADCPLDEAEPVRHGRWEWFGPNTLAKGCMCGTCSACRVRSKYIVNTGICPNCGARMDGDAHE